MDEYTGIEDMRFEKTGQSNGECSDERVAQVVAKMIWAQMTMKAEKGMSEHPSNKMGLYPDWLMTHTDSEEPVAKQIVKINSMVYLYPFSRDGMLYQRLKAAR